MPRGRKSQLFGLRFEIHCEWNSCDAIFSELSHLKFHQLGHFQHLFEQCIQNSSDPICGICNASLEAGGWDYWERHSYFHAWSNYLRIKGKQMQRINDWPDCLSSSATRTTVPDLPTPFECGWEYCSYRTNDISDFVTHVSKHPEEYTDSRYPHGVELRCQWEDCTYVARRLKNLTSHLDSHAQGKRIGCPTCGLLLVNFEKLENHLKRQQVHLMVTSPENDSKWHHSVQPLRCSRCQRLFATEKLLISHIRRHINTIKCPLCQLTVFDKTALERHMLFRHTTDKPFACDHCNYQCKLQHDLNRHIRLRHSSRKSPSASSGAPPSVQHNSTVVMDADLDGSETCSTSTPVLGPLAAAGALSLLKPSDTFTSTVSDAMKSVPSSHPNSKPHWITCPQPGCSFKTTKRLGYLVHIGRKHSSLIQGTPLANLDNDVHYDGPNSSGFYACHLCPVMKRRGFDLSKHLMRAHQLNRPTGHVRFNYTLSADGHYRLQLTRLDTMSVATAVLGENVVNGLLPASN